MIENVRNRLKKKQQISSDQDLRDEILAEVALISGKCDIPVSKTSSKIFRQFAAKLISTHTWINTENEDLPFGEFINTSVGIDDLWGKASSTALLWGTFAKISRRLVAIGASEADVERLFSHQNTIMGHHMTNLGFDTLASRLV